MSGLRWAWLLAWTLGWDAPANAFDSNEWKLAFQDDFDRAELGSNWIIAGHATLVNGRLKFGLDGTHLALINRHFAADVRIEFEAEAAPEKAPCDLSVGLGCHAGEGQAGWGYLLAFGGNFNSMNQIQGGRQMKWVLDWQPVRSIQPGKVHHVCGTKEGKVLTLEVDGEVLVTTTDQDPLGGPGHDMAGLVTWNGLLAGRVRVYERKAKHPDTPHYVNRLGGLSFVLDEQRRLSPARPATDPAVQTALDLFNAGRAREAERAFLELRDPEPRAAGAVYSVCHLHYDGATQADFARAGLSLIALAQAHPGDERLADYAELGRRLQGFRLERFEGEPNGELAADAVLAMGREHNPAYDLATFFKARFLRAHAMEGANRGLEVPRRLFAELKRWYPRNDSLRELTGEQLPWGQELSDDTSSAPAWARALRELYARQCAVLHWWFTRRQFHDGQLGGGWGDDCEILRDWGPLAIVSTGDPALVAGIEKLCQGIWTGSAINPKFGFSGYGDVEHSAEPSADTQPTMMLLRWGDPLWIERNMVSARTIRDIYMGVDQTGHYRFKSGFYGDDRVGREPKQEGDVHYNTRTMKHLQHLAWYGNKEARRVYLSWVEGWLRQTMTSYPNKPAGLIPGQLFYPSGTPHPPSGKPKDWVSTNAPDPDEPPGMGSMIMGALLAGYRLTGDTQYLEPMYRYLMWDSYGPLLTNRRPFPPGSREWLLCGQQGDTHTDTVALFRWLTGDKTADEYLLRFATPYQRYQVDNDLKALTEAVARSARSLRTNFRLLTEELLQTDRAGLPATRETLGAYTGAPSTWRDALSPSIAVTWEVPDPHFAALVVASTPQRLRVWVYSFHDQPVRMGLRLWQLTPGRYWATQGEILPGESTNLRYRWDEPVEFTYRRRLDTYWLSVPPRRKCAIDLRLAKPLAVPAQAPDAGIADRDLVLTTPRTLRATVHSLGSEPLNAILVALEARHPQGRWERVATRHTNPLPAPAFEAVTQTLEFRDLPPAGAYRVVLDPDNQVDELFEGNNLGTLSASSQPFPANPSPPLPSP